MKLSTLYLFLYHSYPFLSFFVDLYLFLSYMYLFVCQKFTYFYGIAHLFLQRNLQKCTYIYKLPQNQRQTQFPDKSEANRHDRKRKKKGAKNALQKTRNKWVVEENHLVNPRASARDKTAFFTPKTHRNKRLLNDAQQKFTPSSREKGKPNCQKQQKNKTTPWILIGRNSGNKRNHKKSKRKTRLTWKLYPTNLIETLVAGQYKKNCRLEIQK